MTMGRRNWTAILFLGSLASGLGALGASGIAEDAEAKQPVRLVFATDLVPLSYEKDGAVHGIFIDIAREAFEHRLGQPVDLQIYPWERAQQMVRHGDADGFITIATKARQEYANCGRIPVLQADLHPLVRTDNPRRAEIAAAKNLADLKPFEIVSYFGNGWAKQNLGGHKVFYAADFQASLRGLALGRGDVGFVTTTAGAFYLREHDLGDRLVMLPLVVDIFEYVLCLGKQSPHVGQLPEFDRVLEVMRAEGAYKPILERYGMRADTLY
ncbi:MAG: transporter substrate-binding domain-containing protein [Proteobacteria bacterium]|nr:transporter substrate-binding domain-containing protein [Pseudomonadota bacterium]